MRLASFDLEAIRERYSQGGTTMYQLGEPTSTADFKKISEEDFKKGDAIGILVAIIVLLVVFGSLLAGITPIVMGILAIVTAIGLVALVGQIWHFSRFAARTGCRWMHFIRGMPGAWMRRWRWRMIWTVT